MATLHRISSVLIMKNAALTLRRCLESLQGLGEIVVHDTGSTDDTIEIARSMGADVSETRIEPFHFSKARNEALMRARNPWILSIDADEILGEGSINALIEASKKETFSGFKVAYEDRASEAGSVQRLPRMRFFRKGCWVWKYRIHERLFSIHPSNRIGELPNCVIEHHPLEEKAGRRAQNLELLKLCVEESPEHSIAAYKLGLEYVLLEEWQQAIPHLERFLKSREELALPPFERAAARMQLAKCFARSGDMERALSEFNRASREAPKRREPLSWAAIELIRACRLEEAITWLERCKAVLPWDFPAFSLNSTALQGTLVEEDLAFCRAEIERAKAAWKAGNKA